jgi:phosphotransferase system IIA component
MTSAFSKLTLHTEQHPGRGIEIRSPVSGLVSQPSPDAGPMYSSGLLPDTLQVQVQGQQLIAPFAGILTSADRGGRQIVLHHPQGLKLEISFPSSCEQQTLGFHWLVPQRSKINAGQSLLQFDPARLLRWCHPLYCLLSISDHPKIQRLHSKTGYVAAGQDPLFWLELKTAAAS